jgi:predicted nucleic acid-binding protein
MQKPAAWRGARRDCTAHCAWASSALILIASTDILPALFGGIVIPRTVAEELQHPRTPTAVRVWMAAPPPWLDIQDVRVAPDATLAHLGSGERDAIALAQELHADLLLIDAWEGRREAERCA